MLELAVTMDSEGLVVEWSDLAHKLFGYTSERALGESLGNLIVPEPVRPYHEMGLRRYVQTRDPQCVGQTVEVEAVHEQGHTVPIQMRIDALEKGEGVFFEAHMWAESALN